MKIKVEMAFDYGKQHFTGGLHECNDVNVIRHMVRLGYGTVINDPKPFIVEEPKIFVEEKAEKKPAPKKRTTRKKPTSKK